jgi:hypothetical protein
MNLEVREKMKVYICQAKIPDPTAKKGWRLEGIVGFVSQEAAAQYAAEQDTVVTHKLRCDSLQEYRRGQDERGGRRKYLLVL